MPEQQTSPAQPTNTAAPASTVLTDPAKPQPATTEAPAQTSKEPGQAEPAQTAAPTTTQTEPPKPAVPEKYELKLPENSPLSAEDVQKLSSFAKEKGLTNEQAQLLLERESGAISGFRQQQVDHLQAKSLEWVESVKADKEIGGDDYQKNVEIAKRVIDRFGTDSFKKSLDDTHLGNHPEMVRIFSRIGKLMTDDQLVTGNPTQPKKDLADRLFPNSKPKPKESA